MTSIRDLLAAPGGFSVFFQPWNHRLKGLAGGEKHRKKRRTEDRRPCGKNTDRREGGRTGGGQEEPAPAGSFPCLSCGGGTVTRKPSRPRSSRPSTRHAATRAREGHPLAAGQKAAPEGLRAWGEALRSRKKKAKAGGDLGGRRRVWSLHHTPRCPGSPTASHRLRGTWTSASPSARVDGTKGSVLPTQPSVPRGPGVDLVQRIQAVNEGAGLRSGGGASCPPGDCSADACSPAPGFSVWVVPHR
ncbi:PREDICTED: uncharacterized protein LOC106148410 [Chinchilla lanigera]|uniref:uncharacterized protein LOC106148410 n=1 Tax=Chinchilla lanigera TaxID=34839 RepID=UPI0006971C37|nr:PREDICTED: uncharacterized protein LOC106148410 [Chinchilla lanigera]